MFYCFFIFAVVLVGCTDSDATPSRPGTPGYTNAIPDTPPPGFAMLMLAPADPPPPTSATGPHAPSGSFWYRMATPAGDASPAFEWFVRAQHLTPDRAYRLELTVDDSARYAIGSARADGAGIWAAHGTLSRFADQYCVGAPAVPQATTGRHSIAVAIKADGSATGGASGGGVSDPERSLECDGNGDGAFDYWLIARDLIHLDGKPTHTGQ
jgi:hypothetical protein